jgi:hypothetical protein
MERFGQENCNEIEIGAHISVSYAAVYRASDTDVTCT